MLMYASRSELIRVPTRQFKWDSGHEWAECCFIFFSRTLGLCFESEAILPVNNTEWEVRVSWIRLAIHFYLRRECFEAVFLFGNSFSNGR